jgi:hypothetical protein
MEILISGIPYKINLIEPNTRADENMGRCDVKLGLITIQRNMPDEIQFSTLIHEIVEAISGMNELNLKHNVISSLSTSMAEVLMRNKIDDFKVLR